MSNDKKKQQKKKQRERDIKRRKIDDQQYAIRQAKLDAYPRITIGKRDADPEFIDAVIAAAKTIDFLDDTQLDSGLRSFCKLGKQFGFKTAVEMIVDKAGDYEELGKAVAAKVMLSTGAEIVNRVPEDIRRRFIPFNDATVFFAGRNIEIRFNSIRSKSGQGGRIYYSDLEPKIKFEEQEYTVGYSRHAIERLCERVKPNYIEYGACGDVHTFLRTCVYFEPVILYGGQPAFVLYNMCENPKFVDYHIYTEGVLGLENLVPGEGPPYYKVGYCPVVFEDGYAKAKTFIPPGFTSTPEYGLLLKSNLPKDQKDRFLAKVTDESWTRYEILISNDNEIIRWFHQNGIPQVKQMKHLVIRDDHY